MTLTVVIPTRDKRPLLQRTLAALLAQDAGDIAWDVVVVNDGSGDDTGEFLAGEAARQPRLTVVSPPANVGRAAARNLGWRAATGRWILFLDDDILAPPGLLAAHLAVLASGDGVGTIGPAVTDPAIIDAPHFHYIDTRGVAKLPSGPAPGKYFVTQNAAVPRDALERIGGFDEDFSAYGFEDMDIGFRLEEAGVAFRVLPDPAPLHIHHHTLGEYLRKKRICGRSSLRQVAATHPHRLAEMRLDLLLDVPGRPAGLGARILRAGLAGWPGRAATGLAARWPTAGSRPWAMPLYARVMDAAVMAAYAMGLAESGDGTPK
jgi:GT2 family glycosyltransferase